MAMSETSNYFDPTSIEKLGEILERMTKPDGRPNYAPPPHAWIARGQRLTISAMLVGILILVALRVFGSAWSGDLPPTLRSSWWMLLVELPAIAWLVLQLWDAVISLRRSNSDNVHQQVRGDLRHDVKYIVELREFSKAELQYALLQYKHRWGRVEGRGALLSGEIRKLGLFPALLVVFIAIPKLSESGALKWLWPGLVLFGAFQLLGFAVGATSERRSQVVDLVQYAIDRASSDVVRTP